MKVLHVIPSVSQVRGGPSQAVLQMVKALREIGVEAEIATTNDNGSDLLNVPLNQRIEYEQVPVWFFNRFSPPLKEFIFSGDLTRWLGQHIRDYDILNTHYLFTYASTCAATLARSQGIPYIVRPIGQLTSSALARSQLKKKIYTFLIERHNLNCAAAVHCTTASEAQNVKSFKIKAPTCSIPLGVSQPRFIHEARLDLRRSYEIPGTTPIVLFLARLHPFKRPDLLLHALSRLAAQNHDFHLILAGFGEPGYLTYLKNLVSSLGLSSHTSIPGFVTGDDKNLLLQGSDIFVMPSFSENFGIAIAEAMAAGLPVIVTPGVQISPEIAAESAGLVVEGEVDAIADAIAQLLTSPNYRRQLGENGKSLVKSRYSWSASAHSLASLYSAIIQKQPIGDSSV